MHEIDFMQKDPQVLVIYNLIAEWNRINDV